MPPDDDGLQAQRALAAHLRDPQAHPAPAGIEERRLRVYRELFFNNIASMLAGGFPVLHRLHDADAWQALVRDFYATHASATPLFTEIAREFLRYLPERAARGLVDPPWMLELAHYEWVETALQLSEAGLPDDVDAHGDLAHGRPVLSPLAWPLAYQWPVTHIGPDFRPDVPPAAPTLVLLQREADGRVCFHALSPLSYRLLERLESEPQASGLDHLHSLAAEAGTVADADFIEAGFAMLETFRRQHTVLGTRR